MKRYLTFSEKGNVISLCCDNYVLPFSTNFHKTTLSNTTSTFSFNCSLTWSQDSINYRFIIVLQSLPRQLYTVFQNQRSQLHHLVFIFSHFNRQISLLLSLCVVSAKMTPPSIYTFIHITDGNNNAFSCNSYLHKMVQNFTDLYAYKRRGDWRLHDMISEPFPYFGNTTYSLINLINISTFLSIY